MGNRHAEKRWLRMRKSGRLKAKRLRTTQVVQLSALLRITGLWKLRNCGHFDHHCGVCFLMKLPSFSKLLLGFRVLLLLGTDCAQVEVGDAQIFCPLD